ncbi:hypothetical protein D6745_03575 [Candidatus Woesearchaeota archaeon]|nr:MAG: hypothetical protein D6745_03575 [Candidatus Woesearchaeota archaeon]
MNLVFALNSFVYFIIGILGVICLYNTSKTGKCKIGKLMGVLGILFLLISLMYFIWFLGFLEPVRNDIALISAMLNFFLATLFFFVFYKLSDRHGYKVFYIVFLLACAGIFLASGSWVLINMISSIFLLLIFIRLNLKSVGEIKKAALLGIFYSLLSIILTYFSISNEKYTSFGFFPYLIMMFAFYFFMLHTRKCQKIDVNYKKEGFFPLEVVKFSLFIITFVVFIMFGTIAMHEMGHAVFASLNGCKYEVTLYKQHHSPKTSVTCSEDTAQKPLLAGGFLLTTLIAFIFLFAGESFTKNLSMIIFSFGLIFANADLASLGFSRSVIYFLDACALIIIGKGIHGLIISYVKDYKKEYNITNVCKA